MNRYEVFSEDIGGETHWGLYDTVTASVLEWFATENAAWDAVPKDRNEVTA